MSLHKFNGVSILDIAIIESADNFYNKIFLYSKFDNVLFCRKCIITINNKKFVFYHSSINSEIKDTLFHKFNFKDKYLIYEHFDENGINFKVKKLKK